MRHEHEAPMMDEQKTTEEARPAYTPPAVRVMDKNEVLRTFQVTSAGISWWTV